MIWPLPISEMALRPLRLGNSGGGKGPESSTTKRATSESGGSSLRGIWEVSSTPGHVLGRLGKAKSRTPSVHVDEKSDEAVVLAKRLNKGRQLSAEVVEGRASPKGNSR